jgi:hypothetical protein
MSFVATLRQTDSVVIPDNSPLFGPPGRSHQASYSAWRLCSFQAQFKQGGAAMLALMKACAARVVK